MDLAATLNFDAIINLIVMVLSGIAIIGVLCGIAIGRAQMISAHRNNTRAVRRMAARQEPAWKF